MSKRDSRLNRRLEKKSKQTILINIAGIIVILILLIKVGIPLLVNFSLFIGQQKDNGSIVQNENSSNPAFIAPPILNPVSSATNSAQLTVSGSASSSQKVKVYLNGQLNDEIPTKNDGSFSIVVDLKKGQNTITAKTAIKDNESNFSESIDINFIDSKPTIELTSPSDGQSFSKDQNSANVSGKTSVGAKVTVNGFWAIVDENNNFSYKLPLKNGDNQIKVVVTDDAGNTIEKEIKVTYSQ